METGIAQAAIGKQTQLGLLFRKELDLKVSGPTINEKQTKGSDHDRMATPFVSVCIPIYNCRKFIRETIASALSQVSVNFEIIICDDGSADDIQDIIDEHQDSRIRYIHYQDNLGLAGNWNRTIEQANGEWIKFLFQDDLFESPQSLQTFLKESQDNPGCKFIFSPCRQINTYGCQTRIHRPFEGSRTYMPKDMVEILLFHGNQIGGPSNVFINKELFFQSGLFDHRCIFALDLLMWIHMTARTPSRYIDSPLIKSRQHQDSATEKLMGEHVAFIDHFAMFHLLREDPLINKKMLNKAEKRFKKDFRISIFLELIKTGRWPKHMIREYKVISRMT